MWGSAQSEWCELSRTVSVGCSRMRHLGAEVSMGLRAWLSSLPALPLPRPGLGLAAHLLPLCSSSVPALKALGSPPAAGGTAAARGAEHHPHPAGTAGDDRRVLVHCPAPAALYLWPGVGRNRREWAGPGHVLETSLTPWPSVLSLGLWGQRSWTPWLLSGVVDVTR